MPRETLIKKKTYYGWWIVCSCGIIGFCTTGTFYYGFTVFIDPIVKEFDWTYLAVSLAASFRSVEMGLVAPVMGFFVDKLGPRKLIFLGGLIGGFGFILLSLTNCLTVFYGAFIILSIGFSACASVVLTTAVANWFHKRVGLAVGLASVGFGMGGILIPLLVWLVNHYGWRTTLVVLGIGTWLIIPSLALLIRHRPEQYGYLPDGETQETPRTATMKRGSSEFEFTAREAIKTKNFWFLSLALAIQFIGINAVLTHIMPYLTKVGLAENRAAFIASLIPIFSIAGRMLFGWLSDILDKKQLLALTFVLQTIGLFLLYYSFFIWSLVGFVITFGIGYGGTFVLRSAIQRQYFGRSAFGLIQGINMAIINVGGIVGPAFTGWVFDTKGNHQLAWLSLAIVTMMAIPLTLLINPHPVRKQTDREYQNT